MHSEEEKDVKRELRTRVSCRVSRGAGLRSSQRQRHAAHAAVHEGRRESSHCEGPRDDVADDLLERVIFFVLAPAAEDDGLVDRHHARFLDSAVLILGLNPAVDHAHRAGGAAALGW
eukprot:CAMPEP_0182572480 /NCGR_PEP_ID=MMETSP1324-20130603/16868_1 /TAXON_ID=236786 /ORGANISM="Florenciella sp., Strain RCC1587" /LENGTH=116 /DNA_ID=CAMNT_0024787407 /DNA_START=28 /DNA_END=378 /DNA_ORIENTATION=-